MPPAARVTDMHVCPMVTGIVPHVGGPILPPGVPTVLIGFLPAATVTDMLTCVGPPDVIIMGSMGVMINFLPAARMGDPTAHGGVIILGEPTVMIGEIGAPSPGAGGMGAIVAGLVAAGVNSPPSSGSYTALLSTAAAPGQTPAALANPSASAAPTSASIADSSDSASAGAAEGDFGEAANQSSNTGSTKNGTMCRGNSLYEQQEPMSCVLASSRMIIKQLTGTDPGEEILQIQASAAGWYDPINGSDPWQIPSLLESHGVSGATAKKDVSLSDIQVATANGKPVMVGLKNPGHRIVVDGVQNNADGSQTVLVRDPGYPGADGCRAVPADEFLKRYNTSAPVISFK